jgi:hypothetical protein
MCEEAGKERTKIALAQGGLRRVATRLKATVSRVLAECYGQIRPLP